MQYWHLTRLCKQLFERTAFDPYIGGSRLGCELGTMSHLDNAEKVDSISQADKTVKAVVSNVSGFHVVVLIMM